MKFHMFTKIYSKCKTFMFENRTTISHVYYDNIFSSFQFYDMFKCNEEKNGYIEEFDL